MKFLAAPLCVLAALLTACNGSAVVTMTGTPSQDVFLAYRVGLASVQLHSADGKSLTVLPTATTVDFVKLLDVSEVLGSAVAAKGNYTSADITLDYGAAQIVYDDGSGTGLTLTPVDAAGAALGRVTVSVVFDPNAAFKISAGSAARLSLDFKLAASNVVNTSLQTVAVTPLVAGSSAPIDDKQVRLRGPVSRVADSSTSVSYISGVMPFDDLADGSGTLVVSPGDTTVFEINGTTSTGTGGLSGLTAGMLTVAYGTLSSTATLSSSGGNASTHVIFTASRVLGGSSVQGSGFDRVSGVVSARSGNALTVEDATLIKNDGTNTFLPGTTIVNIGGSTLVNFFGEATDNITGIQQISVGASIDAFGSMAGGNSGGSVLDASAGHVRIDPSDAVGLVNSDLSGGLVLDLTTLGGRSIAAFDFAGTGISSGVNAKPGQYVVATAALDLSNAAVGNPVIVSGTPSAFASGPPDFTASALLDPTTIAAELVIDWSGGTAAPFVTYDASAIDLDVRNTSIGSRHQIQIGSRAVDIVGLAADPLITPSSTTSGMLFAIGHTAGASVESFNTHAAFIAQLRSELKGTTLATGMTAVGQYAAATGAFSAYSITLFLNN